MSSERVGINKRIADRLLSDGRIDDTDFNRAVSYAQRKAMRVEEAIIELDILKEQILLKFIATIYKTQFVSTERMSKAKLDRDALKLVPKGMARHFGVYPLVLDRVNDKLIIATADPDNQQALDELRVSSGVERVVAMIARPEAVNAAIDRGYDGDRTRFKKLLAPRVGDIAEMIFQPTDRTAQERGARRGTPRHAADWSESLSGREQRGRDRPATGEFAPPRRRTGEVPEPPPPRRRTGRASEQQRPEPPRYGQQSHDAWLDDYERGYDRSDYDGSYEGYGQRRPPARSHDEGAYPPGPAPRRPRTGRYDEPDHELPPPARGRRRTAEVPPPVYPRSEAPPRHPTGRGYDDPRDSSARGRGHDPYGEASSDRAALGRGEAPPDPYEAGYDAGPDIPPPARPYADGYALPFDDAAPEDFDSPAAEPAQPRGPLPHTSSMFPRPIGGIGFGPMSTRKGKNPLANDAFDSTAFIESLRVLVGLLENEREDLRGHSTFVARLVSNIAERISLPKDQQNHVVIASYLHDLGKMGVHHLTALNVAQLEVCLHAAEKLVKLPEQLMESVGLPEPVIKIMSGMYERMSGDGIPDGVAGKDIPMGARILAVADSYADLTRNAKNAYDQIMAPDEALGILMQHAGTVFDANILSVLEKATGGEKILTDLLANRHRFLIIDPDPEETMVLQLRLVEQGFDVHVARTTAEAKTALDAREFALVMCEVDLETRDAGFAIHRDVKRKRPNMAWVFVSSRDSRQVAERAFRLGVDDFIAKPVSGEILVAKLTQLVDKKTDRAAPRGVTGSLSQMSLTDVVQILWHGRKTCALNITSGAFSGGIHFQDGMIVNAIWGDATGEVAFYRLLTLGEDGEFAVDPEFAPEGDPAILASPEALLLEGMRLLDEGLIP